VEEEERSRMRIVAVRGGAADSSLANASAGGPFPLAVAVPVFVVLSWVNGRRPGRG